MFDNHHSKAAPLSMALGGRAFCRRHCLSDGVIAEVGGSIAMAPLRKCGCRRVRSSRRAGVDVHTPL